MKTIVVHNSPEEPLPFYVEAMSVFDENNEQWRSDDFRELSDLVPAIRRTLDVGEQVTELEIIAHGSPNYLGPLWEARLAVFARALRPLLVVAKSTRIYLNGCNTGLSDGFFCIAQALSMAIPGVTVLGSRGFVIAGSAAERNARTEPTGGEDRTVYVGAATKPLTHPRCWKRYITRPNAPMTLAAPVGGPQLTPLETPIAPVAVPKAEQFSSERIAAAFRAAVPVKLPGQLIGSDYQGTVQLEDGPVWFDVVLNGTVVRNALTRETYKLPPVVR